MIFRYYLAKQFSCLGEIAYNPKVFITERIYPLKRSLTWERVQWEGSPLACEDQSWASEWRLRQASQASRTWGLQAVLGASLVHGASWFALRDLEIWPCLFLLTGTSLIATRWNNNHRLTKTWGFSSINPTRVEWCLLLGRYPINSISSNFPCGLWLCALCRMKISSREVTTTIDTSEN